MWRWGCTSGGIYAPCIYLHARWDLLHVTQVSLLGLCDIFCVLINSLVCWFCTGTLGLILFHIAGIGLKSPVNTTPHSSQLESLWDCNYWQRGTKPHAKPSTALVYNACYMQCFVSPTSPLGLDTQSITWKLEGRDNMVAGLGFEASHLIPSWALSYIFSRFVTNRQLATSEDSRLLKHNTIQTVSRVIQSMIYILEYKNSRNKFSCNTV